MQYPSFSDSGLIGAVEAWPIAVEPWWPAELDDQQAGTLAWMWTDGEMQEIRTVAVLVQDPLRDWAEIDLPLMLPS